MFHLLFCLTVCFKLFDRDSDGRISWTEFIDIITCYLGIQEENKPPNAPRDSPEVGTSMYVLVIVHDLDRVLHFVLTQWQPADVCMCM